MNALLLVLILPPLAWLTMVTLFNAVTAPRLANGPPPGARPRVSVLVPARNEETTVERCLAGLRRQRWPALEILVYNDQSTDATGEILDRIAAEDDRVRVIHGTEPPPPGWTGKAHACSRLADHASGQVLIFTDSDNHHSPGAVASTVGWMERHRLDLLSAFPQQLVRGLAEKLVLPVVDLLVYGLLPLWGTLHLPHPSLAAANGQWICFTRAAYDRIGGHAAVKGDPVEDVALARRAKGLGLRTLTLAGTGAVFGRMYGSAREVVDGFSKNLFGIGGGRTGGFLVLVAALFAATVLPTLLLLPRRSRRFALPFVALNLVLRGVLVARYRHPARESLLLHPVGMAATLGIGLRSMLLTRCGGLRWKGRLLPSPAQTDPDGEGRT